MYPLNLSHNAKNWKKFAVFRWAAVRALQTWLMFKMNLKLTHRLISKTTDVLIVRWIYDAIIDDNHCCNKRIVAKETVVLDPRNCCLTVHFNFSFISTLTGFLCILQVLKIIYLFIIGIQWCFLRLCRITVIPESCAEIAQLGER